MAERNVVIRIGAVAAGIVCLGGSLGLVAAPAGAEFTSFDGSAEGAVARVLGTFPTATVSDTPIDGGGPVAGANMNNLGESRAFASAPYPGSDVVSIPGLIPGAVPGAPSLPGYPLYVNADHPVKPEERRDVPPALTLSARSAETSAEGLAVAGSRGDNGGGGSAAQASVLREGATLVAAAQGVADGLVVGPISVGHLLTSATVSLAEDGTLTRESKMDITGLRIGEVAVSLTDAGFRTPGGEVPLSAKDREGVEAALAQAGVRMTYLEKQETDTGVVSAGIRIVKEQDATNGKNVVTFILGRSRASATGVGGNGMEYDFGVGSDTVSTGGAQDYSESESFAPPAGTYAGTEEASQPQGLSSVADGTSFGSSPTSQLSGPSAGASTSGAAQEAEIVGGGVSDEGRGPERNTAAPAAVDAEEIGFGRPYAALALAGLVSVLLVGGVGRPQARSRS